MFLITFRASDSDQYMITGGWDSKDALCNFFENRDDLSGDISVEMFRLMIKSMTIGEAVATYNTLSENANITAIYENLSNVDITCDL